MADDEEFEKELKDMAQGGFPGSGSDDDDEDIFGGDPDFFSDLEDEEEDDDVPPPPAGDPDDEDFAEDQAGEDPDFFADEDGADDFEDEDPDDEDPLSEFMEDDDDDEEEDDDAFSEESDGAGKKGKMIFWGAVSALALTVGSVGFFVVVPMLTGGNAQPEPRTPATYEQPANVSRGYSPDSERNPVSIPGETGNGSGAQRPEGLPSMPGNSGPAGNGGGQEPSLDERPSLGGGNSGSGTPSLELDGPDGGTSPGMQLPGGTGDRPEKTDASTDMPGNSLMPDLTPGDGAQEADPENASADADTGTIVAKLDDVITRLDGFEDEFLTEKDTRELVGEIVAREVSKAKTTTSGNDAAGSGEVQVLRTTLEEMSKRLEAMEEKQRTSLEDLEERIAVMDDEGSGPRGTSADDPTLQLPDVTASTGSDEPEDETAAKEDDTSSEGAEIKKAKSEAARLRRQLASKKRELDAINAKGRGVSPPSRPHMFTDYRLAGMSNDLAWIETPTGVSMFGVGQDVPGAGRIREFREMDGNFAVITTKGVIFP
ncbi:hypothetical protein [Salipiger mucosus]|uniref:Uncharacterized protein n=1 Tax=Salipiger mucosus DSM 16094 TaxID=1123237 RepID=S9QQ06_9RHOB|nr:hypothetical protein [Salipiger mucosus]EPX83501.1 hypothetical protein Salmuc_02109 [Salipiger mucosus DSM 16094]